VTFDDENITPGGLNPFSVMLPPHAERLFRKDLPKPVNADRIKKSNYKASILKLNAGIEQLANKVLAENNSARSIWNSVNDALKKGFRSLDAKAKQVAKLQDDLTKTKARLENASEKVRDEYSKRNSAIREKKDALESLQTKTESLTKTEKDLADVQKELNDLKKEVGDSSGSNGQ
jgi:septal ring factor EnvC (AmiA/AmiB activator)